MMNDTEIISRLEAQVKHWAEQAQHFSELATARAAEIAALREAARWIPVTTTCSFWPDEGDTVLIAYNKNTYFGYWQNEQDGDYENGYKHFRQWFFLMDTDTDTPKYEACEGWPDCWKRIPAPPEADHV